MAAYAALVSLMHIMEQIQNQRRPSFFIDKKQIDTRCEKVGFLQDFIEGYSHGGSTETEVLESQIAAAEDAIEYVVVIINQVPFPWENKFQFLARSSESNRILSQFTATEDMDSIKKKVMKVKEKRGFKDQQPTYSMPVTSSTPLNTAKNTKVGFHEELIQRIMGKKALFSSTS